MLDLRHNFIDSPGVSAMKSMMCFNLHVTVDLTDNPGIRALIFEFLFSAIVLLILSLYSFVALDYHADSMSVCLSTVNAPAPAAGRSAGSQIFSADRFNDDDNDNDDEETEVVDVDTDGSREQFFSGALTSDMQKVSSASISAPAAAALLEVLGLLLFVFSYLLRASCAEYRWCCTDVG